MAEKPAHEFVLDDGDCTTAVLCPICGDVLTAANDEQVGTDTYTSGSSYEPELEGYTYGAMNAEGLSFIGWSLTEGGDVVTSTLWPDSDLAFYAVYQKLHTITYYYYNIDSLDYFEEGSVFTGAGKVTLYTNYSNYYTILGWDADGDGKADYECGEQITLTADMVLYEVVAPFRPRCGGCGLRHHRSCWRDALQYRKADHLPHKTRLYLQGLCGQQLLRL